ncbi:NFX1-type zinc finger-containing protein 1 isoform X1 [Tribolium castaneum]|nr:PREDICTED: NFX1-type zinc finger-containing protein 1 isoform X1 [Tribolium castaneum]|eukprot:XP_008190958.1 PREDICTED: NFX1-type zinc finger-containing protein 1 isoform X1 [Tribolium castaneum]
MQNWKQGNPRTSRGRGGGNPNWRSRRVDNEMYGSFNELYSGREIWNSNNWRNRNSRSGVRRNRSPSTSSERSFPGRNRSGFVPGQQDQRGGRRPNQNARKMGFKALQDLLNKDSEDLILELSNIKRGIQDYIKTSLSDDGIVLFVKVLKKVSDSAFVENKYKVLQLYLDEVFVDKLVKYVALLPMQSDLDRTRNQFFWENTDEFWNNVIGICQDIYNAIPTFGFKVLPNILKSLLVCFPAFQDQHKQHISDGIRDSVNKLNESLQIMIAEEEEKKKASIQKKVSTLIEEEPPDDFHQISVYPNSLELLGGTRVFLRKNIVEGPYKDVHHYLDVQFRLLREDFVGPLRNGIATYRTESTQKQRIENVNIYKKVQFLNQETINEQYCIRLRFDFSRKTKKFRFEDSKKFMFGSLLCFTCDNFKSLLFGKIAQRDVKDLEKGELIVGFDQNVLVDYKANYLMIECGIYFEPYFHVLNVLKNINTDEFPMEKYIIRVDPTPQPPEYLNDPTPRKISIRGHDFFPLLNWPNTNFYTFNQSQLRAFRAALTQEFSVIQGPPGTGKTFLGLKIAHTLLQNQAIWFKKTPMLVICYTNHALDQFLEGLALATDRIIRIGGQSRNQNVAKFNLRNIKFRTNPAVLQQRHGVKVLLLQIQNITENLKEIDFYHSIRDFKVFIDVIPNFITTWFHRATIDELLDWLLPEYENEDLDSTNEVKSPRSVAEVQDKVANLQIEDEMFDENLSDYEIEEDENMKIELDDLFDEVNAMAVQCSIPLITLSSLQQRISALERTFQQLKQKEEITMEDIFEEDRIVFELYKLKFRYDSLNFRLTEGKQMRFMKRRVPDWSEFTNPHKLSPDDRWNLYFFCLNLYRQKLNEKLSVLNEQFREQHKIYEEMRDIENTKAMKNVLVVGMTTTGAARLRSSLQTLKSPIVIVEEAAEILEAHIVSSLTKHCKHLILIGDHQQLKPSTASYNIEKFYNLGISLFERMVVNRIQLNTLNVQHRMRPEIASLVSPTIYPTLQDHPSVNDRPDIKGVDNCLFFIDHKHPEANCEGKSKKNYHEVDFLIYFARHLILNGYEPGNITILAAYLGQMFELQKERRKHNELLANVRIAVLDNYQGEECDIILLSLVRNNEENKIGFLSIENRVCVALSRARNGFYLMGNMDQLCAASQLWREIYKTFERQNAIGPHLALRCQVHPDKVTYVASGKDFLNISEGGCNQKCGADLNCGHQCTSLCHVLNRDHASYRCLETCGKKLCDKNELHLCQRRCYQECGPCTYKVSRTLKCGHVVNLECHLDPATYSCEELVPTQLPCGHNADKPCHCNPETFPCPFPCEKQVEPCGHACTRNCHVRQDPDHLEYKCKKRCAKNQKNCKAEPEKHKCKKLCFEDCDACMVRVRKQRTICPHFYDVPCSSNVDDISCEKPCTKILPCNHKCKNKCNQPCGNCKEKVEKQIPVCAHTIKVKCSEEPLRKFCTKKCPLTLPCGHPCTKKCNESCTPTCTVLATCALKAPCGHTVTKLPCHLAHGALDPKTLLQHCNHPCGGQLLCEHTCSGTCGECSQGRIHKRCDAKCGNPLVCNHICEFPCRQACRPCVRPCPYKCKHSACGKRCGDICVPCKESCPRRCKHRRCSKYCGEICDVPPCQEPCSKLLACGHQCIGFCGDPCPQKCRICDEDEVTEVFFGFEAEDDARFVLLEDCGHIFENTGLETWLGQDDGEVIKFKECPRCKTAIKTTARFSDYVKKAKADVAKVKKNLHGTENELNMKRQELARLLLKVRTNAQDVKCSNFFKDILGAMETRLRISLMGKRQRINKFELNAIESKLQIIEHIVDIGINCPTALSKNRCSSQVKFILKILEREDNYVTDQEIDDIPYELNRLSRIAELEEIESSPNFLQRYSNSSTVRRVTEQIEGFLFGFGKFYDQDEQTVKELLQELSRLVASGIGISEQEKREIVKAMGFRQGHWFKCPNGHPYCIADCGGAMVESKCPECACKIGGGSHTLRADNALASEMDGAQFPAWSETANNMGNFLLDFDD